MAPKPCVLRAGIEAELIGSNPTLIESRSHRLVIDIQYSVFYMKRAKSLAGRHRVDVGTTCKLAKPCGALLCLCLVEHCRERNWLKTLSGSARLLKRGRSVVLAAGVPLASLVLLALKLVAGTYDGSQRRDPGRPRRGVEVRELGLQMARESSRWGYLRIVGALSSLRHELGRDTVERWLTDASVP